MSNKKKIDTKQVIVTGGCGFIGSHLVERLLSDGHTVTVIDNLATGKKTNLSSVLNHPRLIMVNKDIVHYDTIYPYFQSKDWVFHLAALADIVPSIDHPERYFQSNVIGTFNVVEACRMVRVRCLIYAASSSCYGIPKKYPTPETSPIEAEYPYALMKALGEQMVLHWAKIYGLYAVSLRLFNVYGPRARSTNQYGAVFGVFLKQKLENQPLTIVGNGKQKRDFIYVSDVVEAFILAAQKKVRERVFNVGSGKPHSIHELAKMISQRWTTIPKRPGEPDCTWADTSKIKKRLKWKPKISFQEGVSKMVSSIDQWRDSPLWTPVSIQEATNTWFKYLGRLKHE